MNSMGDGAEKVGNSIAAITSSFASSAATAKNLNSLVKGLDNLRKIAVMGSETSDGINAIAKALDNLSTAAERVTGVKAAINSIKGVGLNAAKMSIQPDGKTTSPDDWVTDADVNFDHVDEATEKVSRFRFEMMKMSEISHKMGFDKLKDKVKGLTGSFGKLLGSIKRIAFYRAIRALLRNITQGFSVGVKNLYEWSNIVGNDFKQSMDSLATSANYLKNSLGAMVSPIIDALAPAVEILVDKFVSLLNVINQFFATITGADSWRKAVRQQKEYSENTDSAAAAQKKLNHQLMAFDELNNITSNSGGGGGSGGKTPNVDDDSFVVEALPDWAQGIKDAIDKGDWYGAGSLLAEKLNGLIDDWDAAGWGKKLGTTIQNAISAYNGFMDTTNWTELGGEIADFLNNAISTIDPGDLGHAIEAQFNAAIDTLAGFTATFDWDTAGKWIADVLIGAFSSIKWETLGTLIKNLASGILNMLKAGLDELLKNGDKVVSAIGDFFSGLGWDGLKDVVKLTAIVLGFKALFSAVFGDAGLIAAVKTSIGDLLSSAGLSGGLVLTLTVMAIWATTGIIENIDKYGVDKGLWRSIGVVTPEMKAVLKIDDTEAEKFIEENWLTGTFTAGLSTVLDEFKKALHEAFSEDPTNLPFFKKALEIVNAWLQLLGFKPLEWETEESDTMTQKVGELYGDTSSGTMQKINELQKGIDYVNKHPATITVKDKDQMLQKSTARAGKLIGSNGLGGIKKQYNTELKSPSLYEAEGATTTINSGLKKLNGTKFTTTFKSDSLKTGAGNAEKLNTNIGGVKGKTIKMAFQSDSLKVGAAKADMLKDNLDGIKGKTFKTEFQSPTLKTGAKYSSTLSDNLGDIDGTTSTAEVDFTTSNYDDTMTKINAAAQDRTNTVTIKFKAAASSSSSVSGNFTINEPHIKFAEGGFPTPGDLFVANEAGPELVGTINGRTAVASNQEITGIADAVYNTGASEAALLREQNQLLRQLLAKKTDITLAPNVAAGRWVAQAQTAYARATGG